MTARPWWEAVPPASTTIACAGGTHEVRWDEGRLQLRDHADVEAEQALGALGGDVPTCLALAAAWRRRSDDPALVTLGRRPGEAGLGFAADEGLGAVSPLHMAPPIRRQASDDGARRDDLVALLDLPVALIDRLVLTAMAAAAAQWSDPSFRDRHGLRLGAALAARAGPALRRLGQVVAGDGEEVVVHCTPAAAGTRPALEARRTGAGIEVSGSLPLEWLPRVWGPGLSEPDGRFVLALRRPRPGGGYEVDVVEWVATADERWEAERRPAVLARDGDDVGWRVLDGPT